MNDNIKISEISKTYKSIFLSKTDQENKTSQDSVATAKKNFHYLRMSDLKKYHARPTTMWHKGIEGDTS